MRLLQSLQWHIRSHYLQMHQVLPHEVKLVPEICASLPRCLNGAAGPMTYEYIRYQLDEETHL